MTTRLLLDTHVLIWTLENPARLSATHRALLDGHYERHISAVSIWEISIKQQAGRLKMAVPLLDAVRTIVSRRTFLLGISVEHAAHILLDPPSTRDPFDRLLLAQCDVEDMRLLTIDRALAGHRLAHR